MTVHGAFDLRHAAQLAADRFRNVEQSRGPSLCRLGMPNEPRLEAQNRGPAVARVRSYRFVHADVTGGHWRLRARTIADPAGGPGLSGPQPSLAAPGSCARATVKGVFHGSH